MNPRAARDAVEQLDELGCRIMLLNLALDNPALFHQLLGRVPTENGGRWDRTAYVSELAAALERRRAAELDHDSAGS